MLASLIGAFLSGEALDAVQRAKGAAIAYVVAALLFLTGAGFVVGAGYIAAAREFGSITAAIAFGIGFIVVGILILAVRSIAASMHRRRSRRRTFDLATIAGAAAVTGLPLLLKRGGVLGLLAPLAAFAAYAVYRESRKRSAGEEDDLDRRDEALIAASRRRRGG
jgi:hypothetical protein